ncbi:MAG TPA: DUF4292 domain-containing protein [Saprospiraceae bacterium]|nr:DUF4292 domain-containing protein [Saprospiraceae bacterium]
MMIRLCFFILVLLAGTSCHPSKKSTEAGADRAQHLPAVSLDSLLRHISYNQQLRYFSAKGLLRYESDEESQEVSVSLYSIRDSACLVILKKLGIESVRALMTPDSLHILDRINQRYTAKSIMDWNEIHLIPLRFFRIQDLLIHGSTFERDMFYEMELQGDDYLIRGSSEYEALSSTVLKKNRFPMRFEIATGDYAAHATVLKTTQYRDKIIPVRTLLQFIRSEKPFLSLEIHWNEIKFEPIRKLNFQVPEHYAKTP